MYTVFSDPFYYGYFEYPVGSGNSFKGNHEAMITKDEFERVQRLLGRPGTPRPQTKTFPFIGLIRCGECGAMITAEEKWQIICSSCKTKFNSNNRSSCPKCATAIEAMRNPTLLHYIYYHCTKRKDPNCTQRCIRTEELEKQFDAFLAKIGISEEFKNWAIKYLNVFNDSEVETRNASLSSLQNAYKACVSRLDNLLQLKISPQNTDGSLLSDEEFKTQKAPLLAEKASYEEKLGNTGKRVDDWLKTAEQAFNFAVHARYWFANGSVQEKREILVALGSNLILQDKTLHLDVQKPYFFLKEIINEEPTTSAMFEPHKEGVTIEQMQTSWYSLKTLLPREDSNLEPSSYRTPLVTKRTGLSHHPK